MVNTEIRLIIFFAAKDGEALYSQQKQDQELTVAQIINSLLPNSDWNWMDLWRPTRPSRTNTQKRCPFHYRGLKYKSRKSRDNWTNKQIWLCSTKLSRSKANRVLQENSLVIANTLFQQHKRRLYTWTSPDGQLKSDWLYYLQPKMEKLYTASKNKTGSWLWLRSWTAYCQIQT